MAEIHPSRPLWLRVLRVTWAALLISVLAFSILMAAWGDLREGLMLKLLDDRHAKSFLLQFPEGTKVWVGTQSLEQSRKHPLAQGEPDDSELATEGLRVVLPRAYMAEEHLREQGVEYTPGATTREVLALLAPESELVYALDEHPRTSFTPVVLGRNGTIDYALLGTLTFTQDGEAKSLAFLLRAQGDARVFLLSKEEVESDRLWAEPGHFWARRDKYDGLPPSMDGQVKTTWRWYFTPVEDEKAWRDATLPPEWRGALWAPPPRAKH